MRELQKMLESIAQEKAMAKSIVGKCEMIENLARQNAVLRQDNLRLQEAQNACQKDQQSQEPPKP